jgi:hypothetical protein
MNPDSNPTYHPIPLLRGHCTVMGSGEAFTLDFDARPRVAGHKITGAVVLNVRRALDDKIERIRVRLRGSALA